MKPEYIRFTPIDFLKDDNFIRWQLFHADEDEKYWQEQMCANPEIIAAIGEAIARFRAVRLNDYRMDDLEAANLLQQINGKIAQKDNQRRLFRWGYRIAVAASIAVVFVITSIHYFGSKTSKDSLLSELSVPQTTIIPKGQIALLSGDSVVVLGDDAHIEYDAEGAARVNNSKESLSEDRNPHMNKLIVPCGKRSSLVLADGSKIWVNSGSTVEFPSRFDSKRREITVEGEIYVEVEKDASRPFYVKTSSFNVRVLGTKFNISAYKEDTKHAVVLVEGRVEVTTRQKENIKMIPNQLLSMVDGVNTMQTVDVEDYICWKNGWLQFHSATLDELSIKLSRYYNREIVCDPSVRGLRCTGKLILFDNVDQVMSIVSANMNVVCHYNGNKITLVSNHINKKPM